MRCNHIMMHHDLIAEVITEDIAKYISVFNENVYAGGT